MRVLTCAILAVAGLSVPAIAQTNQPPPAVPVAVVTAERKPVTKGLDFVGRVDAVNRVEIKARVTGYLEDVLFKEGDLIKEGAPLYSIEKGLFEADVEQAEGALERSKAAKILTEVQLQRAEELLAKNAGTAVARDQALAADEFSQRRHHDRRGQSADGEDQSRIYRYQFPDQPARSARPTSPRAMSSVRRADPLR